jgi:hypothetical protein
MRLQCNIANVCELKVGDRRQMLLLMQRHYDNVCPQAFEADLNQKRWVIQLLEPQSGELCGFSTQTLIDVQVDGHPVQALFSGDTIIDRSQWGDNALAYAWGEFVLGLVDQSPDRELWWFLISAGYRTYRFLPVFFKDFYPRHDQATPASAQAVIDALAGHLYPEHYDADSGIIQAQSHQYRLRDGVAEITAQRLRDPHISFFAQKNPGHAAGDELCCVARLTRSNFTRAAERIYPIYSATNCDNPR